jgi:hypothetical protein
MRRTGGCESRRARNRLCYRFRRYLVLNSAFRYAANLKRELPRIPFLGRSTGVSPVAPNSAAPVSGHDFSRAENAAVESAASAAGTTNRVEQGFSPADSGGNKKGALAPEVRPSAAKAGAKNQAQTGGLKASSTLSDLDVFRALVAAGKRLADMGNQKSEIENQKCF